MRIRRAKYLRVNGLRCRPENLAAAAAARPLNSRLDTGRLRDRLELALPDWRDGVARMLREILH